MKCPSCGAEASGRFCSSCGGPLAAEKCPACAAPTPPGSKFCTSCGTALAGAANKAGGGGAGGGRGAKERAGGAGRQAGTGGTTPGHPEQHPPAGRNAAWWVAGVLLVLVILVIGFPILTRQSGGIGPGGGGGAPGMGGTETGGPIVDLSTMSLEEQATVLFNRVMMSNSAGNLSDVAFFLPKALVIHEQLDPTDPDGLYHYALLLMVDEDPEGALAKSLQGLAEVPHYLLLLAVAGEASAALGDTAAAREYYAHLLEVYEVEMDLMRFGYDHHQTILPVYREEAASFLGGR
jgi:tetratricopeptide (TPR) repeat protein